jgi:ribosomal protein S18 acetylase RimI-like enzyme
MVITVPVYDGPKNGPRLINLSQDIPQVLQLLELSFGEALDDAGRRLINSHTGPGQQSALLWRLSPAAGKLALGYVWEEDGRIIGNVTLLSTKITGRYLVVNVAVHPDYRRRGIARILMGSALDLVRARRGREILLQVVKSNTAAIDLYRSLSFTSIGNMTEWQAPASRLRPLTPAVEGGSAPFIRELHRHEWQAAYELDRLCLSPDLNWPEPLPPNTYEKGLRQWLTDFLNGRQAEAWVITNHKNHLIGLANILSEWGRAHHVAMRIHPDWRSHLERPLLAKVIRRLHYLPRRNVQVNHLDDDEIMNHLLQEANFQPKRTLTHMRFNF